MFCLKVSYGKSDTNSESCPIKCFKKDNRPAEILFFLVGLDCYTIYVPDRQLLLSELATFTTIVNMILS